MKYQMFTLLVLQRYRDLKILDSILYASRVELCESLRVDYHSLVKKGSSFNFPIKKNRFAFWNSFKKDCWSNFRRRGIYPEIISVVTEFIRKLFPLSRNLSGNYFCCHGIYPEIISVVTEYIRKRFKTPQIWFVDLPYTGCPTAY